MPNTISSQYMALPVPVVTVDPGPTWATDVNSCLTLIDQHDHSTGKGTQITQAGFNITGNVNFNSANAIALRSSRYTAQSAPINGASDLGCVYVSGVDLYFNDVNGNQIRMTASGSIAGTSGSIGNLVSPASVTYVSGTATYVFQSAVNTPGNLDAASVTVRELVANGNGVTLTAPAALAASYSLTFPGSLPASTSLLQVDASGNISTRAIPVVPTVQKFLSGSGTYNRPAGVLYIEVEMVGGGGGGGGSGDGAGLQTAGGDGGTSTFGTTLLSTAGGTGGGAAGSTGQGGVGGAASLGSGPVGIAITGTSGQAISGAAGGLVIAGAAGGSSALGGGGRGGGGATAGGAAGTNSGSGGGAAGSPATGYPGGSGASGGYVKAIITSPSSPYAYAVGAAGTAGGAGTSGAAGGVGGAGQIVVWEYYQ